MAPLYSAVGGYTMICSSRSRYPRVSNKGLGILRVLIKPEDGDLGYVPISRFQAVIFNTTEQKTPRELSSSTGYSVVFSTGPSDFLAVSIQLSVMNTDIGAHSFTYSAEVFPAHPPHLTLAHTPDDEFCKPPCIEPRVSIPSTGHVLWDVGSFIFFYSDFSASNCLGKRKDGLSGFRTSGFTFYIFKVKILY